MKGLTTNGLTHMDLHTTYQDITIYRRTLRQGRQHLRGAQESKPEFRTSPSCGENPPELCQSRSEVRRFGPGEIPEGG